MIRNYCQNATKKIRVYTSDTHELVDYDIMSHIDIRVVKVSHCLKEYAKLCKAYCQEAVDTFNQESMKKQKLEQESRDAFSSWKRELRVFSGKLQIMIDDPVHREAICVMMELSPNKPDNSEELSTLLRSTQRIMVPLGHNIVPAKQNPRHPVYWLTKYKDFNSLRIQKKRPIKVTYRNPYCLEQILDNISYMTQDFLKVNPNLSWYVIEIGIRMAPTLTNQYDFYYCDSQLTWQYKVRTTNEIHPGLGYCEEIE